MRESPDLGLRQGTRSEELTPAVGTNLVSHNYAGMFNWLSLTLLIAIPSQDWCEWV